MDDSPITEEMRALIGAETEPVTAWDEVCRSEIRRFAQSVFDDNPIFWDEQYAKTTKYEGLVAPAAFPYRAFRRQPGSPDPMLSAGPDEDVPERGRLGRIDVPRPAGWTGFHGGNELEVYQLARPGDVITARTKLVDIYEKQGRSGPLYFEVHETSFANQDGDLLCVDRLTAVVRRMEQEGGK